jgi:hypothetical protein
MAAVDVKRAVPVKENGGAAPSRTRTDTVAHGVEDLRFTALFA